MLKRSELWLILAVLAMLAGAALLGNAAAPRGMSNDLRISTRLTTPSGAHAFRTLLGRFGVDVGERLKPFFDLDKLKPDSSLLLFVAQPAGALTAPEVREVRHFVERGGRLLIAGRTGLTRCFGYVIRIVDFSVPTSWPAGEQTGGGVTVRAPARAADSEDYAAKSDVPWPPPRAHAVLHRSGDDEESDAAPARNRCPRMVPRSTQVLWTRKDDTVAVRLRFAQGGEVILVADATLFSNRSLRTTDAGVLVLGWLIADGVRKVLVDEYHQGFGRAGSLPAATFAWAWSEPAGWTVLQLLLAGALALALAAVRFGPAVPAVERRRRSPLEHLDALAAGLERSGAGTTATRLIATGLRRRLGGSRGSGDIAQWLGTLEEGAQSPGVREAAHRLRQRLVPSAGGSDVRAAANAVEELWQKLKVPTRTPS